MSLLKNRMDSAEEAEKKRKEEKKRERTAIYSYDGKKMNDPFTKRFKIPLIILGVFVLLLLILYVPPLFYSEPEEENSFMIYPDESAIGTYNTYLKDHPEEDFDNDGLTNSMESEYGTSVWNSDTDYDCVSDYAELFFFDSSPVDQTTILVDYVKELDTERGESLETPYKIDDIIFWPDSYSYKAFGSVVRTMYGYRFCNYSGWVKFSESVNAYGYDGKTHYELPYNEDADAWYVNSSDEILLYGSPLAFVYRMDLPLFGKIILNDGFFGYVMDRIFPDEGAVVTCYREASIDEEEEDNIMVTAQLSIPDYDPEDSSRLISNMTTLTDLSEVRNTIDSGKCVGTSLYSSNVGETICVVYGYTKNELLVADMDLNPVGSIKIREYALNELDVSGEITTKTGYTWKGLGYDSEAYGDRISFFSVSHGYSEGQEISEAETETEIMTESETEFMTESESEIKQESETEPATEHEMETMNELVIDSVPLQTEPAGDFAATFSLN